MSENWKVGARQHFANQRTTEKLVPIPVKEWGITVYFWPATSMDEEHAVSIAFQAGVPVRAHEDDDEADRAIKYDHKSGQVAELIARGRDEHGRNLFTSTEFDDVLQRYDPRIIERVVSKMRAGTDVLSPEQAEKN